MCVVTPSAQLTLSVDQFASRRARAFLHDAHCRVHATRLDDAQLLVSELVTNAVRHGASPVSMSIDCDEATGTTVRVSDGAPEPPSLRQPKGEDEFGRGMTLVDLISDEWGVDAAPPGKAVWFRLPPRP